MTINRQINSLLLKSNRVLETRLGDSGLVEPSALEEANKLFLSKVREGDVLRASILRILIVETQKLQEKKLLNYQLENCGIGGILLEQYRLREDLLATFNLDECMATWTIPIDQAGDCTFLATGYYLSDFVKQFWQDKLATDLVWYVTPIHQLENTFDSIQRKQQEELSKVN